VLGVAQVGTTLRVLTTPDEAGDGEQAARRMDQALGKAGL
jgi:hypothetical protein